MAAKIIFILRNNANLCLLSRKRRSRFIYLFIYSFIYLFIYLFNYLFVCLFIYFIYLFYSFFASKEAYPILRQLEKKIVVKKRKKVEKCAKTIRENDGVEFFSPSKEVYLIVR